MADGKLSRAEPRLPPVPPGSPRVVEAVIERPLRIGARVHARAALGPWLVAHALVLAVLAVHAWRWGGQFPQTGKAQDAAGLFAWDGGWYRRIAVEGYGSRPTGTLRFFPLFPLTAAAVHGVTHLPVEVSLIAVAWLAAFGYGAALHALALHETGDAVTARRAVWLATLAPGANVLVLGYTEALAGFLAVLFFLMTRTSRFGLSFPIGVLSGLVRPTGFLLSLPAAIEAVRTGPVRGWRAAAVVAPVLGLGLYLAWCYHQYGNALLPYQVQEKSSLRGGLLGNPFHGVVSRADQPLVWTLDVTLAIAALILLWVCARRLAADYTVWSSLIIASALTTPAFHSMPRYLASAFPLAIALALLCRRPAVWVAVIGCATVGFVALAYLSAGPSYVP